MQLGFEPELNSEEMSFIFFLSIKMFYLSRNYKNTMPALFNNIARYKIPIPLLNVWMVGWAILQAFYFFFLLKTHT